MSAIFVDRHGRKQAAFLAFWERFDLSIDDGRFDGVFEVDDDMPTRYKMAQGHALAALRRYCAGGFNRQQINDESLAFPGNPKFLGHKSTKLIDYNLGLALSIPCSDLEKLLIYSISISDHKYLTREVYDTMAKHITIDFVGLASCLSKNSWGLFGLLAGYSDASFFKDVYEQDDVKLASRFLDITKTEPQFGLDVFFAVHPCLPDSNLRRWHNPSGIISANEFYLRFRSQMTEFVDNGMTDDHGHLEWLEATDHGIDDLPGYEQHVDAMALDIADQLFTALNRIDAALPERMHRVHDCLMHEVSKHLDLRDNVLRYIGKNPGWILMAKQRPDYDAFFLTTVLKDGRVLEESASCYVSHRKAVQTTLREFGHARIEKHLRSAPELLMNAYRITGHAPLIESMVESDRAQSFELDIGL